MIDGIFLVFIFGENMNEPNKCNSNDNNVHRLVSWYCRDFSVLSAPNKNISLYENQSDNSLKRMNLGMLFFTLFGRLFDTIRL
jgi:hypothetical protein